LNPHPKSGTMNRIMKATAQNRAPKGRYRRAAVAACAACLAGVFACRAVGDETGTQAEPLPLDMLRAFAEAFARIKSDYVEPVEDEKLLADAIRGMTYGLDRHSAYLEPESYRHLHEGTVGQFGGLGLEVDMKNGRIVIVAPIEDTPADRAGLHSGDIIVEIDGESVKGLQLPEAIKIMRGRPGTRLSLTVLREGSEEALTFQIKRAVIRLKSVKRRLLEPGYALLRITHFQERTARDLLEALEKLRHESDIPLEGVILDLRNNPGGILNAAVAVSDLFLKSGAIVSTEGRLADANLSFNAKPDDVLQDRPLVVLVNGGSASASEIVAGALQDHERAPILGEKTFGKGSVQSILTMKNETALKLTTAHYYTPNGRSIHEHGIEPDFVFNGEPGSARLSALDPVEDPQIQQALEKLKVMYLVYKQQQGQSSRTAGGDANDAT